MRSLPAFLRGGSALTLLLVLASGCLDTSSPNNTPSNPATETYAPALGVDIASMTRLNDALYIKDVVVGTGAEAVNGDSLKVTYSGYLTNGARFGTNVGEAPLAFLLGNDDILTGWHLGMVGMHVGGKRKLVIGSDLGYGPYSVGDIPSNSTLVFDVELVGIK